MTTPLRSFPWLLTLALLTACDSWLSPTSMLSTRKLFQQPPKTIGTAIQDEPPWRYKQDFTATSNYRQTKRPMLMISISEYETLEINPFLVAGVALVLGIAAQTFINSMLKGDQGLGAFLKDGAGYNRSGFQRKTQEDEKQDPLPWLKLPKLDFVEVAGQETDVYQKLEVMRVEMNQKLDEGEVEEASLLRDELENIMKQAGIEYKADEFS